MRCAGQIADGVAEPMETCFESQELTGPLTGSPTPGEEDQNFKGNETWYTGPRRLGQPVRGLFAAFPELSGSRSRS